MKRARFYFDGYNIYHGICRTKDKTLLWLDLFEFGKSLLHEDEYLDKLYFFTSLPAENKTSYPHHVEYLNLLLNLDPNSLLRIIYGRQGKVERRCRRLSCGGRNAKITEEKEIDVAVGVQIVRDCLLDKVDVVHLVTGDTDLNPALVVVHNERPEVRIVVHTPPKGGIGIEKPFVETRHLIPEMLAPYRAAKVLLFEPRGSLQMPESWNTDSEVTPYPPTQIELVEMKTRKLRCDLPKR